MAQEKRHWIKQSEASFPPSIVSCLSDAVRFRKVLLWVLEGTETQGPLQICLVCKIFSKKAEYLINKKLDALGIGIHKEMYLLELP